MTLDEGVIVEGDANIPGTRYGDYSKIDLDPDNDKKFWFVNEVMSGGRKNIAGVFQIASNYNNDLAIISIDTPVSGALSSNESVTVTIQNLGEADASGFDVSYQIGNNIEIIETYSETITSGSIAQYTFATTADLSIEGEIYTITSSSLLNGDEDPANDSVTKEVTYIFTNDIGVTAITSPTDGEALANEPIVVTIENFGTASQSNFEISYSINGAPSVTENVVGPIDTGTSMSFSFSTVGNFSMDGTYTIVAQTLLDTDSDTSNNSSQVEILNSACYTRTNDTQMTIGPYVDTVSSSTITMDENVVIDELTVTLNIEHTWNSDLDVKLIGPDGTEVILFQDVGGSEDNFTNTVLDDNASESINDGSAPFTGTFSPSGNLTDFQGLPSEGDWTLSITDDYDSPSDIYEDYGGTLLNWSLQICTQVSLSVSNNELDGDFKILNNGNNQFEVSLANTNSFEDLNLDVYNMVGQRLLWKTVKNTSGFYSHILDMSYASKGIYLVRLGDNRSSSIKRIVVE
jgi:subtilisin-like proprotein convertase family protein